MKDKIKTFEEFEARMKSQVIPPIQPSNELEHNLVKRKKVYKPIYLRTSFIAIFLSICLTASIATAMQYTGWKLFNEEGKEIFVIRAMSEEEDEPRRKKDEIMAKYRSTIKNLRDTMKVGELKYFVAVDAYEELGSSSLSYIYNGVKIQSVTQISEQLNDRFLLRDNLQIPEEVRESFFFGNSTQGNFILTEGIINYDLPYHEWEELEETAQDMYLEAKENNSKYIVRDDVMTSNISDVRLKYGENEDSIGGIEIIFQTSVEMMTTPNIEEYIKVTDEGIDYIYNKELQEVNFIVEDNAKKILVSIMFTAVGEKPVEKEALIAIAKSILK